MSTCSIRLNVYTWLLATHLSGTYVSHKWSDSRQAQPSCDYLCLYQNCKSMKFSQFPNELNIKSATFATFDKLNLIHWLHIASWWGLSKKKKKDATHPHFLESSKCIMFLLNSLIFSLLYAFAKIASTSIFVLSLFIEKLISNFEAV